MKIPKFLKRPELLGHYFDFPLLREFHGEWIRQCWANDETYVLQAHRNSYKTTACLVVGAIWYLIFNPEKSILIVRKEYEGAASTLKAITKLYESEKMKALYNELGFSDFRLSECKKDTITLSTKKLISKEGSIDSIGIGGAITGRHYDKIICDDIIVTKDRVSRAEREKTKEFVRELLNIKKAGGTITYTGTPWHKDDAFSILPEPDRYPLGSIYIPELTKEMLDEIKRSTTPSLWAANYELKHISSEDKIFGEPHFGKWRNELTGSIAIVDTAYSGTHFSALTIIQSEGQKYNVKGWVWRKSIVDLYAIIANICTEHRTGTMHIEVNADKGLAKLEMQKYYNNVQGYNEKENKHNKIVGYVKPNWDKVYFDIDCQPEYLQQVCEYAEGVLPDDGPDTLAAAMRIMLKRLGDVNTEVKEMSDEYRY